MVPAWVAPCIGARYDLYGNEGEDGDDEGSGSGGVFNNGKSASW